MSLSLLKGQTRHQIKTTYRDYVRMRQLESELTQLESRADDLYDGMYLTERGREYQQRYEADIRSGRIRARNQPLTSLEIALLVMATIGATLTIWAFLHIITTWL